MAAQKQATRRLPIKKSLIGYKALIKLYVQKISIKQLIILKKEGYWRDLVAFTWNIKTLEGQEDIKEMLSHTLEATAPHDWQIDGEATESDGVVESCISFNTKVAKGYGYLRLRDGKAWTLLTTMVETQRLP